MGIRETLNENPATVLKGAAVVLLFALVLLIYHLWPTGRTKITAKEFYSDDDGTSWFEDDGKKVPPFDHNGKEAVLARVFVCADGHKFVGYLEKFTPEAKSLLENAHAPMAQGQGKREISAYDPRTGHLFKKPHDPKWVTEADSDYKDVKEIHCPNGGTNYQPLIP